MEDVVDFFIPKCQMLGITAEMFGIWGQRIFPVGNTIC